MPPCRPRRVTPGPARSASRVRAHGAARTSWVSQQHQRREPLGGAPARWRARSWTCSAPDRTAPVVERAVAGARDLDELTATVEGG
ncbi:hypothetical protein [Streptomyces sp. NPDC048191]|uniref:hypothetical protein n=1 Tax=Streptomyces sp. NPDC048191 TaxID=3155484 RepID=UPI0033C44E0C